MPDDLRCPSCGIIGPSGPYTDWHQDGDLNCQAIHVLTQRIRELERQIEDERNEYLADAEWHAYIDERDSTDAQ